jgi:DNA-binding NarL/FixJ family response regulator
MAKRVLVVDDHSLFRDGIVSLLKAAGLTVVGEASNGRAAVELAAALRPDLVLLDINMPQMSGLEALRAIRAQAPDTQVVMLTISDSDEDLLDAMRNGARGYLLKSLDAKGFLASLRGLERGEAPMSRQTVSRLVAQLVDEHRRDTKPRGLNPLTERETELLRLVASGLSNKLIGQQLGISENTVKYHMKQILQKLRLQNRAEAAAYAVRNGLVEASTPPPDLPE